MNNYAQNAALKLLEEPPAGVMFILCACNVQRFLPTVRSRCVEISLAGGEQAADEQSLKLAREYLRLVSQEEAAELCRWCGKNEGMDQKAFLDFAYGAKELLADVLTGRSNELRLSAWQAFKINELLQHCVSYTKVNVSVKHIFGLLMVDSIVRAETEDK